MRNPDDLERALAGLSLERPELHRTDRSAALRRITDPAALAGYLSAEREVLIGRISGPDQALCLSEGGRRVVPGGVIAAQDFSDLTDSVIRRIYLTACEKVGANPSALPLAIVATGGYGRRELAPFSDIDITFIPARDGHPDTDRVIRDMFAQVMDICITRCGLQVGYAYRLLEDCASLDHQTASALLDARLIIGSDRLFIQFEDAFWSGLNPTDFIFTKIEERRRSMTRWGSTPRVVEPNLKEGAGGLRDLQTAVWLAQARNQIVAARVRGERASGMLVRMGLISPAEGMKVEEAKETIFQARNALHALARAARNELVITRQEDVARLVGYVTDDPCGEMQWSAEQADALGRRPVSITPAPPVERCMADLYRALALIRRVSEQVMRSIGNSRLILGIGLDCKRRRIVPANDALESDDPAWLLWACELAQKYGLEWSERSEQAAVNLVEMNPVLPDFGPSAQVFTRILSSPGKVYPILQKMADLGILGWLMPEFKAIFDLIPYDASHEYTVGQHSLFAVRHLESLFEPDGTEEQAEMRRVLEELPNPEQLMLAILFHDSGKAAPGRPHSEVSDEIVCRVCERLQWSEEATANVRQLVRHHLLMAEVSRLRDLNLDETIRDFTEIIDDLDRLNMLYLLTFADTRAVGEGVWTQVKGRFLQDLWRRAGGVISESEPVGVNDVIIARARRRLLKDLSPENLSEEEVAEHIGSMPPQYLLNQGLREIAMHIGFVHRVRDGEPVIDFHHTRNATFSELTVCTYDDPQPGLLAKIAGILYASELSVHSAQVLTRVTDRDRIALDTLWVDYRGRQLAAGKEREVMTNMMAVLTGAQSVKQILEKRRPSRLTEKAGGVPPVSVRSVRNDLSETLTVIETGQPDVRGAFYFVCDALSCLGWDIRSARVSVWQNEARASFYVVGARDLSEQDVKSALLGVLAARAGGVGKPVGVD